MRLSIPKWVLTSVLLMACAENPPAAGSRPSGKADEPVPCADSDLAARSAMPPQTECVGSAYYVPATKATHAVRVFHSQNIIPFEDFEGPSYRIDAKSNDRDIQFMNSRLNGYMRSEILGTEKAFEARGFAFRWLDNSDARLKGPRDPVSNDFVSRQYPEGQCVQAKFEATGDLGGQRSTSTTHTLACWAFDFDTRRVVVEVVNYMEAFPDKPGLASLPDFDAEAATFLRSVRPPQP